MARKQGRSSATGRRTVRKVRKRTPQSPPPTPPTPVDYAAPVQDPLLLKSWMGETNGGGSPEKVPGFDLFRAVTAGFETKRIAGPTFIAAQPDGGFFSQGGNSTIVAGGSPASKPENVIGADNRTRVTDTAMTPWRCIFHLEIEYENGPVGLGTGFLIGPSTIITAAHVLVDRRLFGWNRPRKARRVRALAGRNGSLAPYGYFVSDRFDIRPEWEDKDADQAQVAPFDYAAIHIPPGEEVNQEPLGQRLGYFGLKAYTTQEVADARLLFVNNAGYPQEPNKPYGTLWYNAGRVSRFADQFIEYMVDTEGGQSGSPIYFYDEKNSQRYVIAIHTTGDFINRGLRITPTVFEQIRAWAKR
jgi:glutamyl endopeptidase